LELGNPSADRRLAVRCAPPPRAGASAGAGYADVRGTEWPAPSISAVAGDVRHRGCRWRHFGPPQCGSRQCAASLSHMYC